MNKLEKLACLEIKFRQFGLLPNSEYFDLYNNLTEKNRSDFGIVYKEITQIYNRLNTNQEFWSDGKTIHSILEYDKEIASVSQILLKMSNHYGLSLKKEIKPEFLHSYEAILGRDSLDEFLKGINQI